MSDSVDTQKYELLVIYTPDLSKEKLDGELHELRGILKKEGASVFNEELWGLKNFAYRIKKFSSGYYALLQFDAPPSMIAELSTHLRLDLSVVRYMLVTMPKNFDHVKQRDGEERLLKALHAERDDKKQQQQGGAYRRPMMRKPVDQTASAPIKRKVIISEVGDQASTEPKEPLLHGKTGEEKLKSIEKTLDSILENPDIKI
ncbi:MAG: 30S ribosomal protein S6 [Patescibacteria group bacterium]